ncbi:MAG: Clp protease ClpP [Candidatus Omnitrophica bacterium]|nr:Clp protease ClpP [Candidatus Omnitrophota bacterium]
MKLKKLPVLNTLNFSNIENRLEKEIFSRWQEDLKAKDDTIDTITIYEPIGAGFFNEGFTAKKMAALLEAAEDKDVVVSINSPGGSFFEGATIYNLLSDHPGKVTVKIPGMAASAAAVIAMAGDEILISKIGFVMIHNVWGCLCGNKAELRQAADDFESFDGALADVFEARTGLERDEIVEMLDNDTWLNGKEAVEKGFADRVLPAKSVDKADKDKKTKAEARRTIEAALGKNGFSRKERENIFKVAIGERDAADGVTGDPDSIKGQIQELLMILKKK